MVVERTHDYPAKNAVREAWMRFLPQFFSNPTNIYGLYLPGLENLERNLYLSKGLSDENLVGVDYNNDHIAILKPQYEDMQIISGNITEAVHTMRSEGKSPITFANLDFDGSYHTFLKQALSVFSIFPADTGGYLCVTSYCSRDQGTVVQGIINTSKIFSVFSDKAMFWKDYGKMMTRYYALKQQLSGSSTISDHAHLSRELGFLWWIALVMGTVEPKREDGTWKCKESYVQTVDKSLKDITRRALEVVGSEAEFHLSPDDKLGTLLENRTCQLWPDRFGHYAYYTANNQPMRTWMMRIIPVPHGETKPTHKEVVLQLWKMAAGSPLIYVNPSGTHVIFD